LLSKEEWVEMAGLTKQRVEAELESAARRFRAYAKAARQQAGEAGTRTHACVDWAARAEVWDGAALEVEQTCAALMVRRS
jgi:hypothetical protein